MRETITAHGGAIRFWRSATGDRLVKCRDGVMLRRYGKGEWRTTVIIEGETDPSYGWHPDTSPAVRGASTRTTREGRRKKSVVTPKDH